MPKLIVEGETPDDIASYLSFIAGRIELGDRSGVSYGITWDLTED